MSRGDDLEAAAILRAGEHLEAMKQRAIRAAMLDAVRLAINNMADNFETQVPDDTLFTKGEIVQMLRGMGEGVS